MSMDHITIMPSDHFGIIEYRPFITGADADGRWKLPRWEANKLPPANATPRDC